jgi:hypothetical protein
VNYLVIWVDSGDSSLAEVEHAWGWNIEIDSPGKGQKKQESRIAQTAT